MANAGAVCKTATSMHSRKNSILDAGFIVRHTPRANGKSIFISIFKRFLHARASVFNVNWEKT